jgi:iron complex outermembrane receptor protein
MGFILRIAFAVFAMAIGSLAWSEEEPNGLAEITVTAQKVTENLRDVPISISVVNSAQLQSQHIVDLSDLSRAAPNFSFSSNGNPGSDLLEMRGISSAAGTSPVAIYLGDVPITQRLTSQSVSYVGQPEPVLLDLQQVEVLRGPQGTLYGASAEAGVLKFQPNPVKLSTFEGSGLAEDSATKNGGNNYRVMGVLNLPLVDQTLGIRLAVESDRNSGFIDRASPVSNAVEASNINDNETTAARLTILAKPFEYLSVTAGLTYQRSTFGSSNTISLGLPSLTTNSQVPDSGSNTLIIPSLTVNLDMGWANLTSVSSDYTRNAPFHFDGTAYDSAYIGACVLDGLCGSPPILDLNGGLSGSKIGALPSPGNDTFFTRIISQELRLASRPYVPGESAVTWVTGVYYEQSDDRDSDSQFTPGLTTLFTSLYGPILLNELFGGPLPNDQIWYDTVHLNEKQYSAFGDVTYHVGEAFRASLGLRYLRASDHQNGDSGDYFNGNVATSYSQASSDHAATPKASLQYDLTPETMVYATVSKGFRLGGPNYPLIPICAADLAAIGLTKGPDSYKHDSLWNYEVGTKARPSNSLAINADVFYDKWTQIQQAIPLSVCGQIFNTNLGSATSYGAELDATAQPISGLTMALSGGYTHATLDSAIPALSVPAGTHVEGVPEWSANSSVEYQRNIADSIEGVIRGNYAFVGPSHGALDPASPDYNRASYGLAGASIGAVWHRWEISTFVKNLFNDQKIIQTPDHASLPIGYVLTPRTVGVSINGYF